MLDVVDWTIVGPAFAAGLIVLATHVPLGQEVLRRGIIFIDLAIAQVAGLGVIAAYALHWDPESVRRWSRRWGSTGPRNTGPRCRSR